MKSIRKILLGSQGLEVPAIGLGTMGMTKNGEYEVYGAANENEAIATIKRSLDLGCNLLDTADVYGPFDNERLIAKAIQGNRDAYIIASKFGYEITDDGTMTWAYNGKKDYVRKSVERSLKNLGTDYIDLYYLHRLDLNTPIEETVGAMSDLVKEGKIGYIGLSEVSSATIRRAHAVHPITAIESEYSLFERSVEEAGILETLNELGIGFVAYSPLSRGFLTGNINGSGDLNENDFRRLFPKFQGEQLDKNIALVKEISKLAEEKEISISQLALAWVIAKGHLPIPGTKRIKYLEQNIEAASISLSTEEMGRLEAIVPLGTITGDRYDAFSMQAIDQ